MKKTFYIDTIFIFLLPIILIIFLVIKDNEIMLFGSILTVAIFLYEIIIFRYRRIYGFAGIKILSMPSILLLSFTIFIAIPSVYICSNVDNVIKYTYFSSIILFYLFFPLGL